MKSFSLKKNKFQSVGLLHVQTLVETQGFYQSRYASRLTVIKRKSNWGWWHFNLQPVVSNFQMLTSVHLHHAKMAATVSISLETTDVTVKQVILVLTVKQV